eukprot:8664156-Pyramimonas_sp.AAC.1
MCKRRVASHRAPTTEQAPAAGQHGAPTTEHPAQGTTGHQTSGAKHDLPRALRELKRAPIGSQAGPKRRGRRRRRRRSRVCATRHQI